MTIEIAPRFRRSIHLEADFADGTALQGYILSPLARDTSLRMLEQQSASSGSRAWTLVGPYGSGKSSYATFLAALMAGGEPRARALSLMWDQWPARAAEMEASLPERGLVPMLITGQQGSIAAALLPAAAREARAYLGQAHELTLALDALCVREASEEGVRDDRAVVEHLVSLSQALVKETGHGGLMIVMDEMGKLLEWAARYPERSDIYLLQLLAEASTRSLGSMCLVTTLHQSLEAYAEGLPRKIRLEWQKVEGRFELIPYLEASRHLVRLISGAIVTSPETRASALFQSLHDDVESLGFHYGDSVKGVDAMLRACAPLHPTTALCLGPLFRMKLGQNERSLFTFLTSREPFGFGHFLEDGSPLEEDRAYTLDLLYDYVMLNTGIRVTNDAGERSWASAEQALTRLPRNATAYDAELLKCIAILSRVSVASGLRADAETLAFATRTRLDTTKVVLKRLVDASILVYRQFKQAYQIWDGSDLDVPALLRQARRRVRSRGGFAERLQELLPPDPILAPRHYHRTGTLRYFAARYVAPPRSLGDWPSEDAGDGDFFLVIPDDASSLASVEAMARGARRGHEQRPQVIALPLHPEELVDRILDCFAIEDALRFTPELGSDPVARRDLGERQMQALDRLKEALTRSFGSEEARQESRWFYDGQQVGMAGSASAASSKIFDDVYWAAPPLRNELINCRTPSPTANRAQRLLAERLFTHEAEPSLGIEGCPPEKALYLSMLKSGELHREVQGKWRLMPPPEPSRGWGPLWSRIDEIVSAAPACRLDGRELVKELAKPPLGLRPGWIPLLVFVFLRTRRQAYFLYEDNTFVSKLGPEHVVRFMKRPYSFDLQLAQGTQEVQAVVGALGARLLPQANQSKLTAFHVVRALLGVVRGLSEYALQTQVVSKVARRVRSELRSARDPIHLIRVTLPEVLGFEYARLEEDEELRTEYAEALALALREVVNADAELETRQRAVVEESFGEIGEVLMARAQAMVDAPSLPAPIRTFVTLTAQMTTPEAYLEAIAAHVAGKTRNRWLDRDETEFQRKIAELARAFEAAESLTLELGQREGDGGMEMMRVSLLSSQGAEQSAVVRLGREALDREALGAELRAWVADRGLSPEQATFMMLDYVSAWMEESE